MKLSTTVAGIPLLHPLMNAAGTCKTLESVKKLAPSATAAVVVGSITVEPRPGNSGNVYYHDEAGKFSINSLGLPNPGAEYYRQNLPEMVSIAHDNGKPLIVSVAGFSPEEYAMLVELALSAGADLVEVNLGCPNVWNGGKQKRIVCFDHRMVMKVLSFIEHAVGLEANVAVKVSPYSDPYALERMAELIGVWKVVKIVTGSNTFANALVYNKQMKPVIDVPQGLAGLAGPGMKQIALGQVRQFRTHLPGDVQVIGVGGITCAQDVWEYIVSGAAAVQVATAYLERGERVFGEILAELVDQEELSATNPSNDTTGR